MGNKIFCISFFTITFSFALSCFITNLVKRIALKKNWIKKYNSRTIHSEKIPFGGGIGIYLSFLFSILLNFYFLHQTQKLTLSNFPIYLLIPATLIFIVGLLDDFKDLRARYKLISEIFICILLFTLGIKIHVPKFFNYQLLNTFFNMFLTIFWIIFLINAINLIDGIDGLAASITGIASIFLFYFTAFFLNLYEIGLLYLILFGSISGFLVYNWHPAKIFMGDSGSLFIGFILSCLAIVVAQESYSIYPFIFTFLILTIPIIDTSWAIIRRIKNSQGIFTPDKNHIHHIFLRKGFSQTTTVLIFCLFTLLLGGITFIFTFFKNIFNNFH